MDFRFFQLSAVAAVFGVVATVAGCPQPDQTFDDFDERYSKLDPGTQTVTTGPVGDCTLPEPGGEADGTYIFVLSAQLGPKKPLLFESALEVLDDGAGGLEFKFNLIPLRTPYRTGADNESIAVLEPVGPPIELGPFAMEPDGSFDIDLPQLQVTGKANPFSVNDLEATVSLTGQICTDPDRPGVRQGFICGRLEGDVSKPIKLPLSADKNSFSFTAFEGARPTAFEIDCGGTPSDAFP